MHYYGYPSHLIGVTPALEMGQHRNPVRFDSVHAGTSEVEMYLRQVYDSPIAQYISHTTKEAAGEVVSAVEGFQLNRPPVYVSNAHHLYKNCMLRAQDFVQSKQSKEEDGKITAKVPLG